MEIETSQVHQANRAFKDHVHHEKLMFHKNLSHGSPLGNWIIIGSMGFRLHNYAQYTVYLQYFISKKLFVYFPKFSQQQANYTFTRDMTSVGMSWMELDQ